MPDDNTTELPATRIVQCPNDATVLVRGDNGFYCIVCGYLRSETQPTRPPELADYIQRLRRNEGDADTTGLVKLAKKLGLRVGSLELTPDSGCSLKLNRFDGPVLAVQEATGSDKYLVVLCGEASWSTGLVRFFKVEGGKGPSPTRVRLGREAVAQSIGGSLQCLNSGELKIARKSKPRRKSTPSTPTPGIAPPGGPKRQQADGRWTLPTPNPDRQEDAEEKKRTIQAFHNLLPPLTEVLAFLLILGILGAYLFWPWIKDIQSARALKPSDEDYRIDCFILRDASKSPRPEPYDHAERQLLDYLNVKYGDRISYAFFGTDVLPNPISPPSSDNESIEGQRQAAGNNRQMYDTTNFSLLFDELKKTIEKDRQAQAATKRKEHVDVVIILSDGVPDLSSKKMSCPVPGQEFIPVDVVRSFNNLMTAKYATQERIYVRLVLIGGKLQRCISDIQAEWERALGPMGLEVISYSKIGTGALGAELLRPFKRHPHIAFKLHPLEDSQRRLLDQKARFSVAYSARSVGEGGELKVLSGTLVDDQQQEIELHALKNHDIKSTHEHSPIIRVPSPENGEALGKTIHSDGDFIFLEPAAGENSLDFLSEQSTYTLKLNVVLASHPNIQRLAPIVDPNPPTLRIGPCNQAQKKMLGRLRLKPLFLGSIVLSGIFWIGSLAWYTTKRASEETRLGRLNGALERTIVLPYKRWFEALIILLTLMTLGVFFLEEPLLLMACVIIIISSALFLLSSLRESRTAHMLVRLAEFMALPLIIEGAAHYIFK